jgi:hypothetical protein
MSEASAAMAEEAAANKPTAMLARRRDDMQNFPSDLGRALRDQLGRV